MSWEGGFDFLVLIGLCAVFLWKGWGCSVTEYIMWAYDLTEVFAKQLELNTGPLFKLSLVFFGFCCPISPTEVASALCSRVGHLFGLEIDV